MLKGREEEKKKPVRSSVKKEKKKTGLALPVHSFIDVWWEWKGAGVMRGRKNLGPFSFFVCSRGKVGWGVL